MNDNNFDKLEKKQLKLREILNESLVRDILIFTFIYLFILTQNWQDILLLCFPLIGIAFSLYFKVIATNKYHLPIDNIIINFNPIGPEKKHANRLRFTTMLELILLYWIGGESIYHPQLIQVYELYFVITFSFFYSFGFYWLMIDIWKLSRITIESPSINKSEETDKIISFLKFDKFRIISILNLGFFIISNLSNVLFSIFIDLGYSFHLPGTGIDGTEPLLLPFTMFIILIGSPLILITSLWIVYREVTKINFDDFPNLLKGLSEETQLEVINSLKKLSRKYKRDLDIIE